MISIYEKGGDARGEIDSVGELSLPIEAGIMFNLSGENL